MLTPDQAYPQLFIAVQTSGLFADSKTFVDLEPLCSPQEINRAYLEQCGSPKFDLGSFVAEFFRAEEVPNVRSDASSDICEHIRKLWPVLTRKPETLSEYSSRLPLLKPYIVPGGRFNEIYYWDSYFTQLGLAAQGEGELVRAMVDNFADLINTLGFIPNGNRSYFCSRSQPPFFALMVELLQSEGDTEAYARYFDALEREYRFWMDGADALASKRAYRRVTLSEWGFVNRYWDDVASARQESYIEDVELSEKSAQDEQQLYRNLRAGAESGWDFSSRWCVDDSLTTIRTTELLPVDLNTLLYLLESTLARAAAATGHIASEQRYALAAEARGEIIQKRFFDNQAGYFVDLESGSMTSTKRLTLATLFPLFAGIATEEQAASVVAVVEQRLLRKGGWVTTDVHSGEQWDAPNGWAPLQWIAFIGLNNYGFNELAQEAASAWLQTNEIIFRQHGKMIEKYNVEQPELLSGGGEYAVQDGFGWSNGVYLALRKAMGLGV